MRKIGMFFILSIILVAGGVFAMTGVKALFYNPDTEVPAPSQMQIARAEEISIPISNPSRLRIPAIDVDAAIQHVGVNEKGNMANPSGFKDVGWYKYGPQPGASGSAAIAGHLDNGLGRPAVFWRLNELQAGDEIIVEAEDGSVRKFKVTGSKTYPYDDVPTEVIFNPAGSIRLNLITCAGNWIAKEKTYDERLIVFAEPA